MCGKVQIRGKHDGKVYLGYILSESQRPKLWIIQLVGTPITIMKCSPPKWLKEEYKYDYSEVERIGKRGFDFTMEEYRPVRILISRTRTLLSISTNRLVYTKPNARRNGPIEIDGTKST